MISNVPGERACAAAPEDLPASRRDAGLLADLKRRIDAIEARPQTLGGDDGGADGAGCGPRPWCCGVHALDAALPARGLGGGLHDLTPEAYGDVPAVAAFVLALLARRPGRAPVLWAQTHLGAGEFGRPYGPGLRAAGLPPHDLLTLTARRDADVLWALEEALRARVLAAVVGEVDDADFLASRRLALASAAAGTACFLVRTGRRGTASAGTSLWRLAPMAGPPDPWDARAPGVLAWHVHLVRVRGGRPGRFCLEWSHETHGLRLAAAVADRADAAHEDRSAAGSSVSGSSAFG